MLESFSLNLTVLSNNFEGPTKHLPPYHNRCAFILNSIYNLSSHRYTSRNQFRHKNPPNYTHYMHYR